MKKQTALLATLISTVLAGSHSVIGQLVRQPAPVTSLHESTSVAGYELTEVFPNQRFSLPVYATAPPGETNRLFIVERGGRIIEIPDLTHPVPSVFLDIASEVASDWETKKVEGLSSIAFHPDFKSNGWFFVTYTTVTTSSQGSGNHNRLARFQVSTENPHKSLPDSEIPLITQYDTGDGHNINQCLFGPDGYLYVASGDEGDGGNGDDYHNSQRIDKNFFSAIFRIDVDQRVGNLAPNPHPASALNYAIPVDNPFVGATSFDDKPVDPSTVRTEFYAVGLRNPWRMSFDSQTGWLMGGDVGQHSYEEINRIVKGGNYGWSFREGTKVGPAGTPPDWFNLIGPVHQYVPGYGSDQGYSVTGGVFYRGTRLPGLTGFYIFADYVNGNIWALEYDGQQERSCNRILSRKSIAGLALHPGTGDLLLMDHDAGIIWKVDSASENGKLPLTLADTGLFADTAKLIPAPGLAPYQVNVPVWSDNAVTRRWFTVPDGKTIGFSPTDSWDFPAGTIWVQHLEIELTKGDPTTRRRLETRVLVKRAEGVYGISYKWSSNGENASLVADAGEDEAIDINDGGQTRPQTWHYPSRQGCLACHTSSGGYALGFNTVQLNREFSYGSNTANQIEALSTADFLASKPLRFHTLPALAPLTDTRVSREYRALSYLAANCSHCHQPGTGLESLWDARIMTSLPKKGLINGQHYHDDEGPLMRIIVPGSLDYSILYRHLSELGPDRMPPLATSVLDDAAITLVGDWIQEDLASYQTFEQWQQLWFGSTTDPASQETADPDGDGAVNYQEYLLHGNPKNPADGWGIKLRILTDVPHVLISQVANRGFEVQFSNSLVPPTDWIPLETPQNHPFFSSTNLEMLVPDYSGLKQTRFYRVRVFEP